MKIKYMLTVFATEVALIVAMTLAAATYSRPRAQCGLVLRLPNYAIVCTDGTIYINYGGGTL